MTRAAPSERTRPVLRAPHTPVTSASRTAAIWTAKVPTPPPAPLTSTRCPARTRPTVRMPRRAVTAAIGSAAACSKVRPSGLGTSSAAVVEAYSAKAPWQKPRTGSPGPHSRTPAPTRSTTPAASIPATRWLGRVSPMPPDSRAAYGSPRSMCQS